MSVNLPSRHEISECDRPLGVTHALQAIGLVALGYRPRERKHPHQPAVTLNLDAGVLLTVGWVDRVGTSRDEGELKPPIIGHLAFLTCKYKVDPQDRDIQEKFAWVVPVLKKGRGNALRVDKLQGVGLDFGPHNPAACTLKR